MRPTTRWPSNQWVALIALAVGAAASPTAAQQPVARRLPPRGTVRTDTLWSQSLGATKALTVYVPPSYTASSTRRYPVLIYLHGLSGNERNWVDAGHIDRTLDSVFATGRPEAIVVMPDGDDGWYTTWNGLADLPGCRADTSRKERADSYCVPWQHYDDYIARDIVAHVDQTYRTYRDARHRGIAGLSMGGYGAISLALAYPDVFGAAASHSGVLSPRYLGPTPFASPARYAGDVKELEVSARGLWRYMAPAFGRDTIGWAARDPGQIAARAIAMRGAATLPQLLIDCGVDDAYINQNRDLHHTLLRLGVSHQYAEWPGAHTWGYWTEHSAQSLSFLLASVSKP